MVVVNQFSFRASANFRRFLRPLYHCLPLSVCLWKGKPFLWKHRPLSNQPIHPSIYTTLPCSVSDNIKLPPGKITSNTNNKADDDNKIYNHGRQCEPPHPFHTHSPKKIEIEGREINSRLTSKYRKILVMIKNWWGGYYSTRAV